MSGGVRRATRARYLSVAEHGLIGDLHTVALVGTDGTIDWYCCPRFDYALAPEYRYPTPLRQMMQALRYLQANAERLQIDPDRIAIGGDSAGAQIAAQLGALVTTPGYAAAVGVRPTITATQLRALVLACGAYDLGLARQARTPAGRRFIQVVLWAYSGTRHVLDDPDFASWSVTNNVTPAFPPALITVGNTDPLRPHSELLVAKLRAQGVDVETLFFPDDHQSPLKHEYQFNLDTDAGQRFLDRMLAFLRQRLGTPPQP